MSPTLKRRDFDNRGTGRRRIAIACVIIVVASCIWHIVRPALIRAAALASVGCPGRERLLAAALRIQIAEFPPDRHLFDLERPHTMQSLRSHSLPQPGWVAWQEPSEPTHTSEGDIYWQRTKFVDSRFHFRGQLISREELASAPGDRDSDGRWELIVEFQPGSDGLPAWDAVGWAVVRLGQGWNEVLWVGAQDLRPTPTRRQCVVPIWRDEDGDGAPELAIALIEFDRAKFRYKDPQTVYSFRWSRRGGVLVPLQAAELEDFAFWIPSDGVPLRVNDAVDLVEVFRQLLPVPDWFGPNAASTSAPTALPAETESVP